MHALHVQFDAFRNIANVAPGVFRTSIDCNAKSNDIVPIVVGISTSSVGYCCTDRVHGGK